MKRKVEFIEKSIEENIKNKHENIQNQVYKQLYSIYSQLLEQLKSIPDMPKKTKKEINVENDTK